MTASQGFFKLSVSGHVLAASSKWLSLLLYLWDFKGKDSAIMFLKVTELPNKVVSLLLTSLGNSSDFREESCVQMF